MRRVIWIAAVLPILASACTGTRPEQPVQPANLATLQGEWVGTYRADTPHGRSGALMFRLDATETLAQGCAIMRVGGGEATEAMPLEGDLWGHVAPERLMLVTIGRGPEGTIRGKFEPYPDPVCGCSMNTTLEGRIRGNVLEGTYVMEHAHGGERASGTWRLVRRPVS
jgi:hypothetical protein